MILVDSSVWIDYFNGRNTPQTNVLDALLAVEPLAIGDLILTEVLQGFRNERDFLKAREMLTTLTVIELAGTGVALQAAANYRKLRALGWTARKTIDVVIATRCIQDSHFLLHDDRDFDICAEHLGLKTVPV